MTIELQAPGPAELDSAVQALRSWQSDGAAWQLHPGDLGWFGRFGRDATAAAVRTWSREGRVLAVGLLDGATLLRMTTAPDARRDRELTAQLVVDITGPDRGVLPDGTVHVEAPADALLQDALADVGWGTDEPWQPLRRDLSDPVPDPALPLEEVTAANAPEWDAVLASAFGRPQDTQRWSRLAEAPGYRQARSLLARDGSGTAVATITVWSAGPGRPGLVEPMAVHGEHRGRGFGRAITLAGAAALRELGSSTAVVCTPSSNVGAVATYASAGFARLPEVHDRRRDA